MIETPFGVVFVGSSSRLGIECSVLMFAPHQHSLTAICREIQALTRDPKLNRVKAILEPKTQDPQSAQNPTWRFMGRYK